MRTSSLPAPRRSLFPIPGRSLIRDLPDRWSHAGPYGIATRKCAEPGSRGTRLTWSRGRPSDGWPDPGTLRRPMLILEAGAGVLPPSTCKYEVLYVRARRAPQPPGIMPVSPFCRHVSGLGVVGGLQQRGDRFDDGLRRLGRDEVPDPGEHPAFRVRVGPLEPFSVFERPHRVAIAPQRDGGDLNGARRL